MALETIAPKPPPPRGHPTRSTRPDPREKRAAELPPLARPAPADTGAVCARSAGTRELVLRLLDDETGAGTATDLAAATERICNRLRRQLGRVADRAGCDAVLVRALVLARARHPVLEDVEWLPAEEGSFTRLHERIGADAPEPARAGCAAILEQFIDLLSLFIGADLVRRQVARAWPELGD